MSSGAGIIVDVRTRNVAGCMVGGLKFKSHFGHVWADFGVKVFGSVALEAEARGMPANLQNVKVLTWVAEQRVVELYQDIG
jgi:hypothetical protein